MVACLFDDKKYHENEQIDSIWLYHSRPQQYIQVPFHRIYFIKTKQTTEPTTQPLKFKKKGVHIFVWNIFCHTQEGPAAQHCSGLIFDKPCGTNVILFFFWMDNWAQPEP